MINAHEEPDAPPILPEGMGYDCRRLSYAAVMSISMALACLWFAEAADITAYRNPVRCLVSNSVIFGSLTGIRMLPVYESH